VKSRNSSQCNETLLVMTVRPGKKFGFQSATENLQRRRRPDRLRQTVPDGDRYRDIGLSLIDIIPGQGAVMLSDWEGNHGPSGKYWQPTTGFMTMSPVG